MSMVRFLKKEMTDIWVSPLQLFCPRCSVLSIVQSSSKDWGHVKNASSSPKLQDQPNTCLYQGNHKDRLSLIVIRPELYVLMVIEVRRMKNKKTSVCSRVDVPRAYLTLKWRRLQQMRKKKSIEQQVEVVPARSANTKQVWEPNRVVSSSPWIRANHDRHIVSSLLEARYGRCIVHHHP